MNKLYFSFILFLIYGMCKGQNLVPNPSFEDTVYCPSFIGQISGCQSWSSFGNTPDYWSNCSNNPNTQLPNLPFGYQYAHTGNSMTGVITYVYDQSSFPNYREYLGAHLLSNLIIGQKYFISYYVNFGDYIPGCTRIGANGEGIRFSTVPFTTNSLPPINNFANLYSSVIIIDTIDWHKFSGSFIADSAYSYIIFGNFFDDAHTDTLMLWGNNICGGSSPYYYVDDICVTTDSLYNEIWTGIKPSNNTEMVFVYPNPFSEKINIKLETIEVMEICLFDITSRKILSQFFSNSISIFTEQLTKGIYIYQIRNKYGIIKKGKIVKD